MNTCHTTTEPYFSMREMRWTSYFRFLKCTNRITHGLGCLLCIYFISIDKYVTTGRTSYIAGSSIQLHYYQGLQQLVQDIGYLIFYNFWISSKLACYNRVFQYQEFLIFVHLKKTPYHAITNSIVPSKYIWFVVAQHLGIL